MIPRLAREAEPARAPTDLVDGWLKVFLGLLRLPRDQAASIGEELEGHLRERVRDLMVAGATEGDATRQAISELGEAADVAARYRALRNEPRRRLIMHATLFTVAGAALAISVAAFRGGQPPAAPGAVDQAAAGKAQDTRRYLLDVLSNGGAESRREVVADMLARIEPRKLELSPKEMNRVADLARQEAGRMGAGGPGTATYEPEPVPQEMSVLRADWVLKDAAAEDAFVFLGKAANLPLNVRWNLLKAEARLEPGMPTITMHAKEAGVATFLRAVNEAIGAKGEASVDLRVTDGVLEVATRGYFDRRERELVSYDLSGIIAARMATYNEPREKVVPEVSQVITQFVSPEVWKENGGDLAEMTVVGDRLFVDAPARLQPQIKWILGQLPAGRAGAGHSRANETIMMQRYALKHVPAAEVLSTLRNLASISSIDFSECAVEATTNSLLISGTASEQAKAKIAIECLDREGGARGEGKMTNGAVMAVQAPSGGRVYLTGMVSRPGVYSLGEGGITVRRLLVAAGGLPEAATSVMVSDSKDGAARVVREITAEELRRTDGPDPAVEDGQVVCIR